MICKNCGAETLDNTKYCNNCGAPINEQETVVFENTQPNIQEVYSTQNVVVDNNNKYTFDRNGLPDGNFKWGGGITAWFVIMIVWNAISVFTSLISVFTMGTVTDAFDSLSQYMESEEAMTAFVTSKIMEGLEVFIFVGLIVAIINLLGYSILLGKKKKFAFYFPVIGCVISSISSIFQQIEISSKLNEISEYVALIAGDGEINIAPEMIVNIMNMTFVISTVIGIFISVGIVVATYCLLRKYWNRLA